MVSAGNTGATMASALLRMGRIKGVSRPAIATPIPVPGRHRRRCCSTPAPTPSASPSGSCSSPRWARSSPATATASPSPGSALLSIGEEPTKGNPLVKETHKLLADPALDRRHRRHVHRQRRGPRHHDRRRRRRRHRRLHRQRGPQDARGRHAGPGRRHARRLRHRRRATRGRRRRADAGAAARSTPQLDPENTGGAMLLGVDGVCIISHGSSSATRHRQRRPGGRATWSRATSSTICARPSRGRVTAALERVAGPVDAVHKRSETSPLDLVRLDLSPFACRHRHLPAPRSPSVPAETHVEQGPIDRQEVVRADPRPPRRHPRDRARRPSTRATRSPTTSTPTRWP